MLRGRNTFIFGLAGQFFFQHGWQIQSESRRFPHSPDTRDHFHIEGSEHSESKGLLSRYRLYDVAPSFADLFSLL